MLRSELWARDEQLFFPHIALIGQVLVTFMHSSVFWLNYSIIFLQCRSMAAFQFNVLSLKRCASGTCKSSNRLLYEIMLDADRRLIEVRPEKKWFQFSNFRTWHKCVCVCCVCASTWMSEVNEYWQLNGQVSLGVWHFNFVSVDKVRHQLLSSSRVRKN